MMNRILFFSFAWFLAFAPKTNATPSTQIREHFKTVDGQMLSGTLTLPSAPRAVALILQGSGNVGEDGDISSPMLGKGYQGAPAKLSEQIANALLSVNVASLRYSKRGVEDPSQLPNQTLPFLLKDAEAALDTLSKRFPHLPKAVVGFSEGGLIAALLAKNTKLDGLYLLAPALRPIDEILSYQFLTWPIELISNAFAIDHVGAIQGSAFATFPDLKLPIVQKNWRELDQDQNNVLSLINELVPTYRQTYLFIRGLLSTPDYSNWYASLKATPHFSEFLPQIQASKIFVYQGMNDAQVKWIWMAEDLNFFPVKPSLKLYPGLGHAFAPMEGEIREVKTSGPFSSSLLNDLMTDFEAL